jgi:hypothetical protein
MALDLGNQWTLADYMNAKNAWLATQSMNHKRVKVYKFAGYETAGTQNNSGTNTVNPNEMFRRPKYDTRLDHVWLSQVKVYDTVKFGYFTTGDLDVYSEYALQGYSAAYLTIDGNQIPEYAGDLIEWNGKLWEVADQLEPVTWGYLANEVFYRTVMRRTQRTGSGVSASTGVGAK